MEEIVKFTAEENVILRKCLNKLRKEFVEMQEKPEKSGLKSQNNGLAATNEEIMKTTSKMIAKIDVVMFNTNRIFDEEQGMILIMCNATFERGSRMGEVSETATTLMKKMVVGLKKMYK